MSGPQRLLMAGGVSGTAIVMSDSFDRADVVSPIGGPDIGAGWGGAGGGTWGVISNEGYQSANPAGGLRIPTLTADTGKSAIDMSVTITTAQTGNVVGAGLTFRYSTQSSFFVFAFDRSSGGAENWYLQKQVSTVWTTLATGAVSPLTGTLRVVDNGVDSITVYINGASVGTSSDTALAGLTKHGLYVIHSGSAGATSGTGWRFNNFSVTA